MDLTFEEEQALWHRVHETLETEARRLEMLGFKPVEIKREIERAVTNSMTHSEHYDA